MRATAYTLDFLRDCDHAGLLHLSTCYVVGQRDGRVMEILPANYTPRGVQSYDAVAEWQRLEDLVRETEARAESPEVTEELREAAQKKEHAAKDLHGAALENQIRKNRVRWLRQTLTDAGSSRAVELGWPNTYTFTKSLSESLIRNFLDANPAAAVAVVRPAIVESSLEKPFLGWNEGINTSASLSYLLGTFFRQLPTNEAKVPGHHSGRSGDARDDADFSRAGRAQTRGGLSSGDFGGECLQHGPLDRTHRPGTPQILSGAERPGTSPTAEVRRDSGFEGALRQPYRRRRKKRSWKTINRTAQPFSSKPPLARAQRELEKVIKLISLFEPFILHNDHVFEAANIERLSAALPEDEQAEFGYDARALDWWDYWINVHIPALRKWCYPLIEGRQLEPRPRRSVPLADDGEEATRK